MSLWLSDNELVELTGYRRRECQKRALAEMKVPFRARAADGFPLVDRQFFSNGLTKPGRRREPDFSSINGGH